MVREILPKVKFDNSFFKALIDSHPDIIFIYSKERVIYSNEAGLSLLKLKSLDEISKIQIKDFDQDHQELKSIIKNKLKNTSTPYFIKEIKRLDGSILYIGVFEMDLKFDDLEAKLLFVREVEDKNPESELRKSTILKAIPDLVFIINKQGIIIDYNIPQDARQYMQRPDKKGEKLEDYVPKSILGEYFSKIQYTLESKEISFLEYDFPISNRVETFEARILYYETDKVLAIIRNITRRKAFEEEKKKQVKIESIELIAGGIAHDFNNLLTKIIGDINLAKTEELNSDLIQGYLTEIETAIFQARKLTNQLLAFSKGGESITKVTSIKEIIEETVKFFLSGSKSKVKRTYENDKLTVEVESGQIELVISNLIINADQAMPDGGLIEISVDVYEVNSENMPGIREGKYVRISIADEGEGVKEKDRIRLFEPYYTTKKTGSGLGLTTSFSIVKKHHGYMQVADNTPRGAIFRVFLPYAE